MKKKLIKIHGDRRDRRKKHRRVADEINKKFQILFDNLAKIEKKIEMRKETAKQLAKEVAKQLAKEVASDIARLRTAQREIAEKTAHVHFVVDNLVSSIADIRRKTR